MKKLIAFTLALCMLSYMTVFADDIQDFLTDGDIHMEITDAQIGEEVMVMVMPEEKKWENIEQWRELMFSKEQLPIVYDTVIADDEGRYNIDFVLTDMGKYNVYVGEKKYVIRYTNKTANASAISELKEATNSDAVYSMLSDADRAQRLSLNSSMFVTVKDDTKTIDGKTALQSVASMVYDEIAEYPQETELSCEQVQKLVDKACLIAMLNGNCNTKVSSIGDYLDVAGIEEAELLKYYNAATDAYVTEYLTEVGIKGISDFNTKLFEGLLYTSIRYNDNISQVMSMLTEYAGKIGIVDVSKITVSMVRTMVGKTFTSLEAVAKHVNNYVEPNKNQQGGGGGGGSNRAPSPTGIGSVAAAPVENNPIINSDVFDDLDSVAWAKEAINSLAIRGIVNGRTTNKYMPNDTITREEFVKLIVTALSLNVSGDDMNFDDVKETDWFYPYVRSAFNAEIIKGIEEGLFGTGQNITRQDMAVIVARSLYIAGVNVADTNEATEFADDSEISDYARESVEELQKKEIMVGDDMNCFNPLENATRAEAAQLIYKIYKHIA